MACSWTVEAVPAQNHIPEKNIACEKSAEAGKDNTEVLS